jgi:hypothetical protein
VTTVDTSIEARIRPLSTFWYVNPHPIHRLPFLVEDVLAAARV